MGRMTEAFDYINQEMKPAGDEALRYKHIDIKQPEFERIRKELKKERKTYLSEVPSILEFSFDNIWEG